MKKQIFFTCLLLGFLFLGGGCSFLAPGTEMVAINVEPDNVIVMVNGIRFEESPVFSEFSSGEDLLVSVYRPQSKGRYYAVHRKLSTAGWFDAFGSVLIFPAFGLLSSGAWTFETHNIFINLNKNNDNISEIQLEQAPEKKIRNIDGEKTKQPVDPKKIKKIDSAISDVSPKTTDTKSIPAGKTTDKLTGKSTK